jgi:hypothetical protein
MNRETLVWLVLFVAGGAFLAYKATTPSGLGTVHVKPGRVDAQGQVLTHTQTSSSEAGAVFSPVQTVGLWIAAFLTLSVFSYLYRDNVFYKLTEAVIVGVSAGIAMVAGFWDSIVAQLMAGLTPELARAWALPGLPVQMPAGFPALVEQRDWTMLVPLVLGVLLFCRFLPKLGWLAKWPLAFVVGTFAGLRLVLFLDADFISQIRNTLLPLIVMSQGQFDLWLSLKNIGLIASLLAAMTYFFFSVEHTGAVGRVARVGIWVLMVTFGASFAFTVMGRITLLTKRFEFLFADWLRLI